MSHIWGDIQIFVVLDPGSKNPYNYRYLQPNNITKPLMCVWTFSKEEKLVPFATFSMFHLRWCMISNFPTAGGGWCSFQHPALITRDEAWRRCCITSVPGHPSSPKISWTSGESSIKWYMIPDWRPRPIHSQSSEIPFGPPSKTGRFAPQISWWNFQGGIFKSDGNHG